MNVVGAMTTIALAALHQALNQILWSVSHNYNPYIQYNKHAGLVYLRFNIVTDKISKDCYSDFQNQYNWNQDAMASQKS